MSDENVKRPDGQLSPFSLHTGNFKYQKGQTAADAKAPLNGLTKNQKCMCWKFNFENSGTGLNASRIFLHRLRVRQRNIWFVSQSMSSQEWRNSKVRNSLSDSYATSRQDGHDAWWWPIAQSYHEAHT
jgi:hypothetical protein